MARARIIGRTRQGRAIKCLTLGSEGAKPRARNVLVVAREHGPESSGSFAVEAIVEHILGSTLPTSCLEDYVYHIVPIANPDGVANGTKLPQPGPNELSDLHYTGLTAEDPTCVALREEILSLRPGCFINYHSYLFPVPELVFYEKQDGMRMLDALVVAVPWV